MNADDNSLLLDIGLYADADRLRETLIGAKGDLALRVVQLDCDTAQAADWDAVLNEVLRCNRCITV